MRLGYVARKTESVVFRTLELASDRCARMSREPLRAQLPFLAMASENS